MQTQADSYFNILLRVKRSKLLTLSTNTPQQLPLALTPNLPNNRLPKKTDLEGAQGKLRSYIFSFQQRFAQAEGPLYLASRDKMQQWELC